MQHARRRGTPTIGSDGQDRLVKTITMYMQSVPPPIRERAVAMFAKVDESFGKRMAADLLSNPAPKPPAKPAKELAKSGKK